MRKLIMLAMVLGLLLTGIAQAQSVGVCQNSKTGVTTFATAREIKTGKCPKGFTFIDLGTGPTGALIGVYDANGKFLGNFLGSSYSDLNGKFSIYLPSLSRIVEIDTVTGNLSDETSLNSELLYEAPACSGEPLIDIAHAYYILEVITNQYVTGQEVIPSVITVGSVLSHIGCQSSCTGCTGNEVVPAQVVQLPFQLPVALPMSLK